MMKNILLTTLISVALLGCDSSEAEKVIDEAKRIEITQDNVVEILEITSNFGKVTNQFSNGASATNAGKESNRCAISGSTAFEKNENDDGSVSVSFSFDDCEEEADSMLNGSIAGRGTIDADSGDVQLNVTGSIRTVSFDSYSDMDVEMSVKSSATGIRMTYTLDYDILYPDLIGEVQVKTAPALTIDSNENLTGKVTITGKNNSVAEIIYDSYGETYYFNGEVITLND